MSDGDVKVGRMAIRDEGNFVNVYYALPGTMKGAKPLISVDRGAALLPGVRDKIIALGQQIVGELIFEVSGARPTWGAPERAPEHERAGHG